MYPRLLCRRAFPSTKTPQKGMWMFTLTKTTSCQRKCKANRTPLHSINLMHCSYKNTLRKFHVEYPHKLSAFVLMGIGTFVVIWHCSFLQTSNASRTFCVTSGLVHSNGVENNCMQTLSHWSFEDSKYNCSCALKMKQMEL